MKYGKGKKITYSLLVIALAVFLTVAVIFGLKDGYGGARAIDLGLDLAGGVSTEYRIPCRSGR